MQELRGRVAVVTGAASGMGLAFARRFAAEGMRLALADIEGPALEAAAQELATGGAAVFARRTDVSRWDEMEALASETLARFGSAHVVCLNAGVVTAGPAWTLSLDDWAWVLGVNLWGVIHGVKAFLPHLVAQDEGHIVGTASTAGLVAAPSIAPYNVSKFGVVALMESVARDLQLRGSRVGASVLCPGEVATRITEAERNRPAGSQHESSAAERAFYAAAGPGTAQGLAPAEVAERLLEAVRTQRFWILTHPEWKEILGRRLRALVEKDALPRRYP